MPKSEKNVKAERRMLLRCFERATGGGWFGLRTSAFGILLALLFIGFLSSATAEMRFPPPEFESGYEMPTTQNPVPDEAGWRGYLDIAVLAGALGLATWVVHRKRSRKWIVGIAGFSLLYFGFIRQGCVCAIGSVQNVSFGMFNNGYSLPLGVMAFFGLPLVAALLFGRTFCAAVCPHGALQDLLLLKPIKVPRWLERGLGVIPFIYLGLAVMFAAVGAGFIICQYDPFISVFRLSGSAMALSIAAVFLVLALFVGRPYCRFLCPYGALLKMGALLSRWKIRVTPDICTECRLCPTTCPFGVILESSPREAPGTQALDRQRHRLLGAVVAMPLMIALGVWGGMHFGEAAAGLNPEIKHATWLVNGGGAAIGENAAENESPVPHLKEVTLEEVMPAVTEARSRFRMGGAWFGGWVGLVLGAQFMGLVTGRRRSEFEPERGGCFGCARCFEYCPQERIRVGLPVLPVKPAGLTAPEAAATAAIVGVSSPSPQHSLSGRGRR